MKQVNTVLIYKKKTVGDNTRIKVKSDGVPKDTEGLVELISAISFSLISNHREVINAETNIYEEIMGKVTKEVLSISENEEE